MIERFRRRVVRARLSWGLATFLLLSVGSARAATRHSLRPGLGLEMRADDGASERALGLRGKLSPELGYQARDQGFQLDASYALEMVQHLRSGDSGLDHRLLLTSRIDPSRRLQVEAEAWLYRVEDSASLPRFGIARVPVPALWAVGELSARHQTSRLTRLELGYRGEASRLFVDDLPLGVSHAAHARAVRAMDRRTELAMRYRLQLIGAGSELLGATHLASLGARYRLTRQSFVALEAGPLFFRDVRTAQATPVLMANVEWGWASRGNYLGLSAGRDVFGSAGYAAAVWADSVQLALGLAPRRELRLHGAVGFYRNGLAPRQPLDTAGSYISTTAEWSFSPELTAALAYDRVGQSPGASGPEALTLVRNVIAARVVFRSR